MNDNSYYRYVCTLSPCTGFKVLAKFYTTHRCIRHEKYLPLHTEKYFWNLIKSNWNQVLFTVSWLIWNQTDVRFVLNKSVHGKCNLISVWFIKISKRFLCVYVVTVFKCKSFWSLSRHFKTNSRQRLANIFIEFYLMIK